MKKLVAIAFFHAALLSGCTHYYYVANVQNVPLFKEKNEYRLSGIYAEGNESNCVEVQGAYSVTDKIGIMTNFMSARNGDLSTKNYGKGNYIEGAIGYYKPIKKHEVVEVYGGLGGGNQHHEYTNLYYDTYQGSSEMTCLKYFIQPSLGLTFNEFDVALSTRFCGLAYTNIENHIYRDSYYYDALSGLSNKNHFFIEPALTIRGGWKQAKLQLQAAYIRNLNSPAEYFSEEYHISIGLYITIAERYRR